MEKEKGLELLVQKVIEIARQSASGESYKLLTKAKHYKVGIVANVSMNGAPILSIECLLQVFSQSSIVDLKMLEKTTEVVRSLNQLGFLVTHEDDGWLLGKKVIEREEAPEEIHSLQSMVEEYYTRG